MATLVTLEPTRFFEHFSSLTREEWDEPQVVRSVVQGPELNQEYLDQLADLADLVAREHPHVEIWGMAQHLDSTPNNSWVLRESKFSGYSPKSAIEVAEMLRYRAMSGLVPVSLTITVTVRAKGARFIWERAAGMQSPTPIYVTETRDEDPVWTLAEALAYARKNWHPNMKLPHPILEALYEHFGLGQKHSIPDGWEYSISEREVWSDPHP